ncbi:hypothetical protein OC845_004712 [Tilletia horrida]|nr:hypothetical protein OC845_004712 [Tilletia horrida]
MSARLLVVARPCLCPSRQGASAFFSSSCVAAAKDASESSKAAFEQRRIIDDLRAATSSSSKDSSLSKGTPTRPSVNDSILRGDILQRAQSRPSGLAAAAALGAQNDAQNPSLLDRITAEGKPWKQLNTGQKVARSTRYSTRFFLVLAGGTFTLAVIYTLGTELFAPNSPTVIYADAIRRVKKHDSTYTYLLTPFRFLTHPPRNDMTDPSETLLPLPASARSNLRAHKPVVSYSFDPVAQREVMRLHFWVMGREKGTELSWFEVGRSWTEHQLRQLSARLQEAWEQANWPVESLAMGDDRSSRAEGTTVASDPTSAELGRSEGIFSRILSGPYHAVQSALGAVTRPVGQVGVGSSNGNSSAWSRRNEPGTFTTAEVVAELERDNSGVFQYRSMYMRVPHDGLMPQRVWIIRKLGEVHR